MAELKTHLDDNIIIGDTIDFDLADEVGMAWTGEVDELLPGDELTVYGEDPGQVYNGKIPVFRVWWNGQRARFEGRLERLAEYED